MTTQDTFQIASTGGTTTSLLAAAAPPMSFLSMLPPAPQAVLGSGHATAGYSPVIGSGGSPSGGGWPFQDFNIMNDPEGNLSALPAIYWQGTGGPAGDPEAFLPNTDDYAAAGYADAGAGMNVNDCILNELGSASYQAGATQLNDSNLHGAEQVALASLTEDAAQLNWSSIANDPNVDIATGAKELLESKGNICSAAVAGAAGCMVVGVQQVLQGPSNPEVKSGEIAYKGAQCILASSSAIGQCLSMPADHPLDANENFFLGTLYRSVYVGLSGLMTTGGGGGVDGGDARVAIGGSAKSFDATLGGRLNYLTESYNSTTGGINVLHA